MNTPIITTKKRRTTLPFIKIQSSIIIRIYAKATSMAHLLNGTTPLSHLGIIRVTGEDACKFLQGQLTQDFVLLGTEEARLCAFLSAKGRMQASFIGFKLAQQDILLICHLDLLATTLKRLSMFVLRSKLTLSNASADFTLCGVAGDAIPPTAKTNQPWLKTDFKTGEITSFCISLYPALNQARVLCIVPKNTAPFFAEQPPISTALWQWSEVQSGVATLSAASYDKFVPQMLNYESLGGINFKKGCYPGQEVVARSQFRGSLKRRTYLAHIDAQDEPAIGTEIMHSEDAGQPCGSIVQVASAPQGGFDILVCLQIAATQNGTQFLMPTDGAATPTEIDNLQLLPLPYSLVEDI